MRDKCLIVLYTSTNECTQHHTLAGLSPVHLHDGASMVALLLLGVLVDEAIQEAHHGEVLQGVTVVVN